MDTLAVSTCKLYVGFDYQFDHNNFHFFGLKLAQIPVYLVSK